MKVLHLIGGGDVGGAKSHVLSLVKELGKHIDVKLISFRTGAFADDARAMGINVEIVKTGTIFSDVRKVLSIVKNEGYELIHSHGAKANMIAVFVKKFTGLPVVTTVHSDYRLDYLQNIFKMFSFGLINTLSLRFLDYYIGVSKNFKTMLIERKFSPQEIFTVYNGINFNQEINPSPKEDFFKKYNLKFDKNDVIIGILARLDPVKGLDIFLKAASVVIKSSPSTRFLIAGDGPERKSLEKKAASYGLCDNVFFLGFVNQPYDFLNCIDINTLTSLSESFPYAILEGSLLKKATISSNVGGISDLIESGINGFLFEPGDYMTLANHILTLIKDSSLRKNMGDKLHEKASTYFSLDNMCKTQLDIYETILIRSFRNSKSKYRYDAVISGYYGFKNIGDDAMLMAIIDNLRMYRKDLRILVLSRNPLETSIVYNVDSINRFNLLKILHIMKNSKLFINGGGSLIQDNTSTRSLVYYLGMIWLAKKMGMKVMIYANGIGPLNKEKNRRLTKKIVNQVDIITLREELSYEELNSLQISKPQIKVTADPALTIMPEKDERINQLLLNEGIDPKEQFIGISVRKWNEHEKYESVVAQLADYIVERYGVKPLFIAMHYPGDLTIIQNIVSKMKNKSFVITNKPTVSEMLGIIGKTQMLIGMRLHALIFAASLGIPVVGMVYEPKVEGFMQYVNQMSAGHVNSLELEHMKKVVDETWKNRDSIKKDLGKTTALLKDKALENARIAIEIIDEKPL
ncbi:polysaccharide pyruvyl transferase CsaB [Acetivibrio mesophilus]|uniref:Polysaccharide pyruvyl transferase CsaB n=1 Tax=Acetivibrio mesophilus TaxID=2487273 RepID=A0A4Q0I6D6_9FIRM|nr:polysaccharide pyruvyl transferase CsaB [Acetivibrio mesophilus]RXE59457.1 polysaccharide pyruvyl transferase CsaB [Acetivibrio mesophilus]HHV30248.1 polysaccharide pyruvyl transferase CsaB [Clostridium sp.]